MKESDVKAIVLIHFKNSLKLSHKGGKCSISNGNALFDNILKK